MRLSGPLNFGLAFPPFFLAKGCATVAAERGERHADQTARVMPAEELIVLPVIHHLTPDDIPMMEALSATPLSRWPL